jgi:hypothetical protein
MRGAIHPLPNTPSWRGAHLKAQGQLYLYLQYYNTLNNAVERKDITEKLSFIKGISHAVPYREGKVK